MRQSLIRGDIEASEGSEEIMGEVQVAAFEPLLSHDSGWEFIFCHGLKPLEIRIEKWYQEHMEKLRKARRRRRSISARSEAGNLETKQLVEDEYEDEELRDVPKFSLSEISSLYTAVYKICLSPKKASDLYRMICMAIAKYMQEFVLRELIISDSDLLLALVCRWDAFKQYSKAINAVFLNLNTGYCALRSLPDTAEVCIECFRGLINEMIRGNVVRKLVQGIRASEDTVVSRAISVLVESGVYDDIEEEFLKEYERELDNLGESLVTSQVATIHGFVEKAHAYRSREKDFVISTLLPKRSREKFAKSFNHCVLNKRLSVVLGDPEKKWTYFFSSQENSHCNVYLYYSLLNHFTNLLILLDIELLFDLYRDEWDSLQRIAQAFESAIAEKGNKIVENRRNEAELEVNLPPDYDPHHHKSARAQFEYVESLISLYDLFHHFLATCFDHHPVFEDALRNGFKRILHKDIGSATNTELLAVFCDYILNVAHELRPSQRRADQSVEAYLDKLAALFSYSPDYDLFTFVYRQYMASRLLENQSHSEEAERSMVAKMRLRAGVRFTSRLEGMLNDMTSSKEITKDFRIYLTNLGDPCSLRTADLMEMNLLTRGIWPTFRKYSIKPPNCFSSMAESFREFFSHHRQSSKKVLRWVWDLGTVTMKVKIEIPPRNSEIEYVLVCTTSQAFLLSLFDQRDHSLGFFEIAKLLDAEEWVVKRLLHSLSCGRFPVLRKIPSGPIISTSDLFEANSNFEVPFGKFIRLPYPDMHSRADFHCRYDHTVSIKSFIVRMMKREKHMRHGEIIERAVSSLERFHPDLKSIAIVLENLVENDYLQVDPLDRDLYHYIP